LLVHRWHKVNSQVGDKKSREVNLGTTEWEITERVSEMAAKPEYCQVFQFHRNGMGHGRAAIGRNIPFTLVNSAPGVWQAAQVRAPFREGYN